MKRAVIAGPLHPAGHALIEARPDIAFDLVAEDDAGAIAAALREADGLVLRVTPLTAEAIAAAPRLAVVSRYGVGYDNVDVAALTARGIALAITGTANSASVAEHAIGLMIALLRRFPAMDRRVRQGRWRPREYAGQHDLAGKALLVVGFGRIGSRVTARAIAFDMRVIAADPYLPAETVTAGGAAPVVDFREALGDADIVSLHLPALARGEALLGDAEFARFRPGAYLINTARGSLIDEPALERALDDGRLAGAALDVFASEPPDVASPLLARDDVIVTPHAAALTAECAARMAEAAVRNLIDGLDGRLRPAFVVNPTVLARP